MTASPKQQLHDLVDRLDEADVAAVLGLTRHLVGQSTPPAMSASDADDEAGEITIDARGPAEARLTGYGIRIWAVIGALKANAGDVAVAAADYDLPPRPWRRQWPTTPSIAPPSTRA